MTARTALWVVLPALALVWGGCGGDKRLGKYVVVDMEKTLAGIKDVPPVSSRLMTLPEYREQIRKQYAGKALEFTAKPPHAFLIPVPLEGSVEGVCHGGWMRDPKDKHTVLVYYWLSGSAYLLWGRATPSNGVLVVKLDHPAPDAPALYFRKGG